MLKKSGKQLIAKGFALADVSNRNKETGEKSALGFATKSSKYTVLIKSSLKKKIHTKLERKKLKSRFPTIIHAVKLYFALNNMIQTIPGVYVCRDGSNEGLLRHYLKLFLKDKYEEEKIVILKSLRPMFGKTNIAHECAKKVTKKGKKPSLELKENHFKNLKLIN